MNFNADKLKITFMDPMTPVGPAENRKYTLTHSDETGMMFLDIGDYYNFSAVDEQLRDELLGKWQIHDDNSSMLFIYAYVGNSSYEKASYRYDIFKSHMTSALQAIINGDKNLFNNYPYLLNAPVYVKFDSTYYNFDNYEHYGYIKNYLL